MARITARRLRASFLTATTSILLTSSCLCGCGKSEPKPAAKPPAKVERVPSESDLAQITLTPEAESRLGLSYAEVVRKPVRRTRTLAGEVVVPPGRAVVVSAPVAGTLTVPEGSPLPPPGSRVKRNQPLFTLVPLLTPERFVATPAERAQMANARATLLSAQIAAAGDAERAGAEVQAAKIAYDRAVQLLQDKVGSAMAVDDAQARLLVAQKTLEAAEQRRKGLANLTLEAEAGSAAPVPIVAPDAGVLRSLSVARGQTVAAGATLFEIVDLSTLWLRVPIYVGAQADVVTDAPAEVGGLAGGPSVSPRTARPVAAPPSADPLSATADLFYEIDNSDGALRPGERLGVTLPLRGETEGLVVPWGAVLIDIHGGTWVYVRVADHVFRRARIEVRHTDRGLAVLSRGPVLGTPVVVDGAAELFGTEFGPGK